MVQKRPPYFEVVRRVANWESPADYIVFKDGSQTVVKDGSSGAIVYNSSTLDDVLNYIISNLSDGDSVTVSLKSSTYDMKNVVTIDKNVGFVMYGNNSTINWSGGSGTSDTPLKVFNVSNNNNDQRQYFCVTDVKISIPSVDYLYVFYINFYAVILKNIRISFSAVGTDTKGIVFYSGGTKGGYRIVYATDVINAQYAYYSNTTKLTLVETTAEYCTYGYYFTNTNSSIVLIQTHGLNCSTTYHVQCYFAVSIRMYSTYSESATTYDFNIVSIDVANQNQYSSVDIYDFTTSGNTLKYSISSSYKQKVRLYGRFFQNSGTATFSGDGSTTQFTIAHGLVAQPSNVRITPASADAAGDFYVTTDATNIYVNYKTAPASGTSNVVLMWYAEV